jgi:hypothetical protein
MPGDRQSGYFADIRIEAYLYRKKRGKSRYWHID